MEDTEDTKDIELDGLEEPSPESLKFYTQDVEILQKNFKIWLKTREEYNPRLGQLMVWFTYNASKICPKLVVSEELARAIWDRVWT